MPDTAAMTCPKCGWVRGHMAGCEDRKTKVPGPCVHCKKRPGSKPRGMCTTCYRRDDIRCLYPPVTTNCPNDETMEDLDRMIAEQLRPENLPKWWPTNGGLDLD